MLWYLVLYLRYISNINITEIIDSEFLLKYIYILATITFKINYV